MEHQESLERIEAWVAANMVAPDGERMLDRARTMTREEAADMADFLDELPW